MESENLRIPQIVDEIGDHSDEITDTRSLWMYDYTDRQRNAVMFLIWTSAVACVLSLVMMLAVIVPLFKKRRRNRASTYNLYLVFLAIPDLVYNAFLVSLFARFEQFTVPSDDGKTFPPIDHPYETGLLLCCGATALYMNAIIAYEIMRLLRSSKCRKRCKAPNLKTATMQAGCTYGFGIAIFFYDYYIVDAIFAAAPRWVANWIIIPLNLVITVLLPIFYLCWVCFRIYWEGLFFGADSRAGKRLTVLVRYFFRIIVIYVGLWVPTTVLFIFKLDSKDGGLRYYQACVIYSLQVWVSFGLSLTKPDVRKNVVSLLNCYKKRPGDGSEVLSSTLNSNFHTGKIQGCGPCVDSNGDVTGDENCIGSEETTPTCDEGENSIKTLENDNFFDFAGADAPVEIDPEERPSYQRFFIRRHKSSSDLNQNTLSTSSYRMNSRSGSQILLGTARSGSGVMSEPFTLDSIRGSFSNMTHNLRRTSMARKSISRASITRANITRESLSLPTNKRRSPRHSGGRPGGRMPRITSERITSSGMKPAGEKDKITNYRIGMENHFSEHNKIGQDTIEKLRDDTLSSRGLDLDDTMLDSFFLDQTPPSNHGGGYRATPKQHRRWMKDLRRNIRALGRQLKNATTPEEEKRIYRQSIYHQKKALEMASNLSSNLESYASSRERTQKSASSESERAETIWSESHNAETIWTDVPSDDSSYSSSSECSACSTVSDDSAIRPAMSNDPEVDSSTMKRWIKELRQNIFDMKILIDQEECTQAQRVVMQRAIDSQKETLISLQSIDEAQFSTIRFGSGGSGNAPAVNNHKNVDHQANSAFLKVPLEAIIDTSEDFRYKSDHRHSDSTQKMSGSSEQRWSGSEKQRRSGDIEGQQLQEVDEKADISWRGQA